jgi:spermidine/putrescine-binding protein
VGDLSVKGLQVHYFKNANNDFVTTSNTVKAEAKNYGIKYNFGDITVGANKKVHQQETTIALLTTASDLQSEITETAYAAAYAVNKDLTIGLLMAKATRDNSAVDQKVKGINIGYALGPVDLSVGYAQNTDQGGVAGADTDHVIARLIGKF